MEHSAKGIQRRQRQKRRGEQYYNKCNLYMTSLTAKQQIRFKNNILHHTIAWNFAVELRNLG